MSDPEAQGHCNCSENRKEDSASYHTLRIDVCHLESTLTKDLGSQRESACWDQRFDQGKSIQSIKNWSRVAEAEYGSDLGSCSQVYFRDRNTTNDNRRQNGRFHTVWLFKI